MLAAQNRRRLHGAMFECMVFETAEAVISNKFCGLAIPYISHTHIDRLFSGEDHESGVTLSRRLVALFRKFRCAAGPTKIFF
jgi:hypothetical protein